jgi:hypothetical protein
MTSGGGSKLTGMLCCSPCMNFVKYRDSRIIIEAADIERTPNRLLFGIASDGQTTSSTAKHAGIFDGSNSQVQVTYQEGKKVGAGLRLLLEELVLSMALVKQLRCTCVPHPLHSSLQT